jgi:MFS family permease
MIDNIDNAGMYSGLFIAIYSISQILSCGFWGKLSDQLGKKNTIMFGLVTSAILYLFFGLSQNFYLTLFIRFLTGLFNANSPIIKSYISDISNEKNKAINYGFLTMSWSIGIIFGSLIGGNTFGLLFNDYPVLLPSLISIIIYSIASLIIYNFIESDDKKFDIIEYVKNYKYNFLLFDIIELWGDKNIIFSILIYVFVTITDITLSEILPLWMVSTIDNGGLQYTSNQISYIYTVCSVISIFIQPLFIFCDKFFERIMMYRCFIIISMILTVIIPYTSASSKSYLLFCAINILRYVIASWNFSIIYLIISASSEKENVGHINGVAQSFGSVCKVIFPLVFNPLYSWSSNKQKSSYINYHFVFNIVAILYIIPFILSYFINLQKIEIQSKQEINNNNMHSV